VEVEARVSQEPALDLGRLVRAEVAEDDVTSSDAGTFDRATHGEGAAT
jgi:hypothetical protein